MILQQIGRVFTKLNLSSHVVGQPWCQLYISFPTLKMCFFMYIPRLPLAIFAHSISLQSLWIPFHYGKINIDNLSIFMYSEKIPYSNQICCWSDWGAYSMNEACLFLCVILLRFFIFCNLLVPYRKVSQLIAWMKGVRIQHLHSITEQITYLIIAGCTSNYHTPEFICWWFGQAPYQGITKHIIEF